MTPEFSISAATDLTKWRPSSSSATSMAGPGTRGRQAPTTRPETQRSIPMHSSLEVSLAHASTSEKASTHGGCIWGIRQGWGEASGAIMPSRTMPAVSCRRLTRPNIGSHSAESPMITRSSVRASASSRATCAAREDETVRSSRSSSRTALCCEETKYV
jgi:hypothetical protein